MNNKQLSLLEAVDEVVSCLPEKYPEVVLKAAFSETPSLPRGVVFGYTELFNLGLKALLHDMGKSAPPGLQIELKARQCGDLVTLTGQFSDFDAVNVSKASTDLVNPTVTLQTAPDMSLAMAHHVFKLHGGELKTVPMCGDHPDSLPHGIASFTLLLPTGSNGALQDPPDCGSCHLRQMNDAYARDLAMLTPGTTTWVQVFKG